MDKSLAQSMVALSVRFLPGESKEYPRPKPASILHATNRYAICAIIYFPVYFEGITRVLSARM
jgi:hypothetical protein